MAEVKKILFPLEFAKITPAVLPWVELMAAKFEAQVHVLHVVPTEHFWGLPYVSDLVADKDNAGLVKQAVQHSKDFVARHFQNNDAIVVNAAAGDPAKVIVEYCASQGIDLIVMAVHGTHGFERTLYGSVADQLQRHSSVPMLFVNPKAEPF